MTINTRVFQFHYFTGGFWLRVFGHGMILKDVRNNPLIFSQRGKGWQVGWLYINTLAKK